MSAPDASFRSSSGSQPTRCEHADRCGGCPIIALPYDEQLALKRGRVVQSLARYASLELVYTEPVVAAEPYVGYRTRAKLIVAPGGTIGLFAKGGGHHVVDIPDCRVLSPALAAVAAVLRERVAADEREGGAFAPFGSTAVGALRAVDLREVRAGGDDDPKVLVTLVLQRERVGDASRFERSARDLMAAAPVVAGVALNYHEGDAPQILGNETVVVAGVTSAQDRLGASVHLATYGSFVQAHRGQAARVHAMLAAALGVERARTEGRTLRVLDLYGGSGAIGLGLAAAGASVVIVESFAPAVANVEMAARSASVDVRAVCSDVASALRALVERGEPFDAAVVNPPRRGLSPAARDWIGRLAPATLAYVSCDPDTLARDLDHLGRLGYATTSLRPLDMIPLTDEVESVCILRRTAVPPARVLFEDETVLVVDKGAHESTFADPDYAGSLVARVRRISGAEEAAPAHRIDVGTSGLVVFGRREEHVVAWAQVLAAPSTRKVYVAAARGVTPSKGAITRDLREGGRLFAARTRYRRLAVASGHSVLRVIPEQGRTHQIRRHLAAIGHPVIGDERYGHAPTNRFFEEKNGLDRAFLHCVRIEIDHPATSKRLVFEAPLAGDLRAVLERTSGPGTLRFLDHKNALGTYGAGGTSSLPPAPDSFHERGSVLDVDASSPTLHPELTTDDDELDRQG